MPRADSLPKEKVFKLSRKIYLGMPTSEKINILGELTCLMSGINPDILPEVIEETSTHVKIAVPHSFQEGLHTAALYFILTELSLQHNSCIFTAPSDRDIAKKVNSLMFEVKSFYQDLIESRGHHNAEK